MRPVIGITTYVEPASWGQWNLPAALIPYAYVRGVESAGGRALLVPPSEDGIEETLDALDGVLFSGGGDLDPAFYGADAHEQTAGVRADRDSAELALLQAALSRDMPVLAICRGSQVLNVARGGDLVLETQHLQVLGLDPAPRIVAPGLVEEAEPAHQCRLRQLGPAECRGEVDAPACVGVNPRDSRLFDLLDHSPYSPPPWRSAR